MNLTKRDLTVVLSALAAADRSERELVECYRNRHTGKLAAEGKAAGRLAARYRKLRAKIAGHMSAPATPPPRPRARPRTTGVDRVRCDSPVTRPD